MDVINIFSDKRTAQKPTAATTLPKSRFLDPIVVMKIVYYTNLNSDMGFSYRFLFIEFKSLVSLASLALQLVICC